MSDQPVGRAAIRAAMREIDEAMLEDPTVVAAAHVICAMGGHIPMRDPESSGSCRHHLRVAAAALQAALDNVPRVWATGLNDPQIGAGR